MKYQDYIPHKEPVFHIFQGVLITVVETNATVWLIPAEKVTALKTLQAKWLSTYEIASNHLDRNTKEVRAKNDALKAYVKAIREFVSEYLTFNSKVTNADRVSMGLTVRDGQHTPTSVPVTFPNAEIDLSTTQQHTIHFIDSGTGEKAKPDGVHGCEIWVKVAGEEPKLDSDYTFLGTDTKSSFVVNYGVADIGKRVWYRFRWVSKRGQVGPWSRPYATVVA